MSQQFKTKEFYELQKKWYDKLAKTGFKDLEQQSKEGKFSDCLKTGALENISHSYTIEQFKIKEEYYRLAGQFLYEHKFRSKIERQIWEMHTENKSIRTIVKALKAKGHTAYKDLVHGVIKRLAAKMKENARNR